MSDQTKREPGVGVWTDRGAGRITLNRPKALNSLTKGMVDAIDSALTAWADDSDIGLVVLGGTGSWGTCAGGDIRAIYESARTGDCAARVFWQDEYRMNARINRHPKPCISIMDGVVMGGGVGLFSHCTLRVVTERASIAMPEVGIGFVPDVGGTYLLSRTQLGELGTHLALTADRVGPADAILCGLADFFVPSAGLPQLLDALAGANPTEIHDIVRTHSKQPPAGELAGDREWINECYTPSTVEEIVHRLRSSDVGAAHKAAEGIVGKSPTALKVTLRALRNARELATLEECLEQEYRTSCALLASPDLVEGIRAQIVDKDRCPRWCPPDLDGVGTDTVERFFALGEDQLDLFAVNGSEGVR